MKAALKELNIQAEVEKVTDVKTMAQRGVMMTPAVIVDGVLKCQGKIPEPAVIAAWLAG